MYMTKTSFFIMSLLRFCSFVFIKSFPFHRSPINYLLVNLAVADILLAMFMAPSVFFELPFSHHPEGFTGRVLCKFLTHANIAWIGGVSSIVTFLAIAIERYYAVIYPLGNKGKLTKGKLKVRETTKFKDYY